MFQRNSIQRKTTSSLTTSFFSPFNRASKCVMQPVPEGEMINGDSSGSSLSLMFTRESKLRSSTGSLDHHLSRDKCAVCGFLLKSREKVKLGKLSYHPECFRCVICQVTLNPKTYPTKPKKGMEEQLYCDMHRKPASLPNAKENHRNSERNSMDLFDLIARTQNSRIDDQRCELPGVIHKAQSVTQLASEISHLSDHDKVEEMLRQSKGPYPQVIEPLTGGYWIHGFTDKRQSDSDHMLRSAELDSSTYELLKSDSLNYFKEHFLHQEHQNFIGQDESLGPVVVSVKKEVHSTYGALYRTIVRTKNFTSHELLQAEDSKEPSIYSLARTCDEQITTNKFFPVTSLQASSLIKDFDDRFLNRNFKFGVIYQAKGQTKEEQFFGNNSTTPAFSEFLEVIGQRVHLKGFDRFRGGLDTLKGQTGLESIHTDYEGREVMFHVSTMLPYTDGDTQQVQRKRHIGNDIVAIVFQEENTPFIPNAIASQFLHVFIVIQPVEPCSENTRYKISVAARQDVPNSFGPILQKSKVVRKEQLREFLLTKLLNAEYACHSATQFKEKMERTRLAYITDLYDDLMRLTLDSWCGLSSTSTDKTASGIFDSLKKMAIKKISDANSLNKKSGSFSPDVNKNLTQEQRISKLSYTQKKLNSGNSITVSTPTWDRHSTNSMHSKTWQENSSVNSFRSRFLYKSEADNASVQSDSPKEQSRHPQRFNGRSSSPTSLGSCSVDDDEGELVPDQDSDTGVGSLSPTETPHGTWEARMHASKSFNGVNQSLTRCSNCDPDLDYVALLKKEITDLKKLKVQYVSQINTLKTELSDIQSREKTYKADLKERTKQNLKLQHQIDELKNQTQSVMTELSRHQTMVAGMSGEEIV